MKFDLYSLFMYAGFLGILSIVLAEIWMQRKRKIALYNVADTITNVSCGMSDRLFSLFFDGAQYVIWTAIGSRFGIFTMPGGWMGVILCLLISGLFLQRDACFRIQLFKTRLYVFLYRAFFSIYCKVS